MPVRKFKPTSPGRRFMSVSTFEEITKSKPEKSLTEKLSKKGRTGGGNVALADLVMFTRQLATMVDAGLAMVHSLSGLADQTTSKAMRDVIRDVCLIRARVLGIKGGKKAEAVVEVIDRYDEATGFTAMERLSRSSS